MSDWSPKPGWYVGVRDTTGQNCLTSGRNKLPSRPVENTQSKRYNVVNHKGEILESFDLGFKALQAAGEWSDQFPGKEFVAIDTRDGSEYGVCLGGEIVR